tara:strand:- start:931 stop:1788 length:858 start_codon:yes stop_codon:yes gene_type:complete
MDRRRRKDEPFNPFAPNASQKARDRKEKTQRQPPKQKAPETKIPQQDLASKQKAAMDALRKRREIENQEKNQPVKQEVAKPKHQPSPQPKPAPKTEVKRPNKREDRLADLRAKSAATAQFAKEAQDAKKSHDKVPKEVVPEIVTDTVDVNSVNTEPIADVTISKEKTSGASNVFKTIKTEVVKKDRRPKRRRPADKRGGGRQPQSKKLDRRKYLEYKYAARDLLENDSVSEEHRSNILGQIWAKGERSGVNDAIEFINEKEAELIIPEDVAEEFRKMVKKYTTKR